MIELTPEMKMAAYREARMWADLHGRQTPDDRMLNAALAAALAIVERDYVMRPATHRVNQRLRDVSEAECDVFPSLQCTPKREQCQAFCLRQGPPDPEPAS